MKSKTKRSSKGKVSVPLYRWMMFWLLVLANVALVAAIFGNVDVRTLKPVSVVDEEERSGQTTRERELEAQVTVLEGDLNRLQRNLERKEINGDVVYIPSATDYDFDQECYLDPQQPGLPETYVTYIDKETSVSVTVPYSFSWGTLNCPPVQSSNTSTIAFGPAVGTEGGESRDSWLHITEATSTASALAMVNADSSESGAKPQVRQRVINGLTVFSYKWEGIVTINHWVAVGRNYTYRISSLGWLTDAEAVKIIQSLRVTR